MKKIFLSGIVCLFFITKIVAQNNLPAGEAGLPPVYEIKSDTAYQQELSDKYYQVLDDKAGNWTIEQVSKTPLSNQFRDRNFKPQGVDTSVNTYWFRYILKNTTGYDISIALDAYGDKTDYYVFDSTGKFTHYLLGGLVPWSKKNGIKANETLPIKLKANARLIIYNRMYNKEPGIPGWFRINFYNNEKNLNKLFVENQDDYYQATSYFRVLLTGFLLLAALFNFFFFLTVKEKVYLYFSLFLITLSFIGSEFLIQVLAREHYRLSQILNNIDGGFALFFLLYFIRHYFQTFVFTKRWDKYLIAISFLWLIYSTLTYLIPALEKLKPFQTGGIIFIVIIVISSFITLLKFKRLHHSNVKDFIIAVSPFLIILATALLTGAVILIIQPKSMPFWFGVFFNVAMFIALIWLVSYFSWALFRRYDSQSKALSKQALELEKIAREKEEERSRLIELQKIELEKQVQERTAELNSSLQNLKSTQSQLIQSEKMASLGELTAGIAHEIQNPLNFVNNFSEVNKEMLEELKAERLKPKEERDEQTEDDIINDVIGNSEKINHHGKRAGDIVKGMLQHSQKSTGVKEPTDINALADEYLRLSYHGMKAKDKGFAVEMKINFDSSIGKINIIPQDIGRVLLNLFNNAFYAVNEQKSGNLISDAEEVTPFQKVSPLYKPTVSVTTRKSDNHVFITVSDNGNGIPQKIVDKIFQPFFTTKPTGQGTGLGLSLSYDIIKAHGGEIKVESLSAEAAAQAGKENTGATFIIQLPII